MKKHVTRLVACILLFSMMLAMAVPVSAATGELPSDFEYAPYSDSLSSSVYTPWLKMVHMTTSTQKANNIVGGENCQQVRSVAASDNGQVVFAGTDTNGIWKTENGGEYWYNTGAFDYVGTYIADIEFVPGSITEAYMISESRDKTFYDGDEFGLFKTEDGGKSWYCVIAENDTAKMVDEILAFDLNKNLYVALNDGIYKISQNGIVTELYMMPSDASVISYSIDVSTDGNTIIAAYSDGFYYSTNGGSSFTKSSKFSEAYTADIHPSEGWWYVASDDRIYISKNNGSSWTGQLTNITDKSIRYAKFSPLYNGKYRYYVAHNELSNGVRYSDNNGTTWSTPTFSRSGTFDDEYKQYYRQGFDFGADGIMYISSGGMFKSNDNGKSFTWKSSGLSGLNVSDIAFGDDGKMYMAAVDVGTVVSDTAYTSKGNYPTFRIESAEVYTEGDVIEIDPSTGYIYLLRDNKILRSKNGGKTYQTLQTCSRNQKFIKFLNNKVITNDYYSENNGDTWNANTVAIDAISDVDNNVWWKLNGTSYDSKLQVSTDCGATWKELPASQKSNRGIIKADVADKNIAYLVTKYGIAKYTTTGMETIYAFPGETTMCFAQNPENNDHMLVGTSKEGSGKTAGLYETVNGGKSWYAVNGIPGTRSIMGVEFSKRTDEAFILSCNGLISYDYNEYENQKTQISFNYGDVGTDTQDDVKVPYGTKIILPQSRIVADPGYGFIGWSDGTTTYAAGDEYTAPSTDVTLTAVWGKTGEWVYNITKENSAFVTTETTFGGVNYTGIYDVEKNNIEANNGIAVVKRTSGVLYYNLDLSALKGKIFTSAKLKFAVMSTGDSWFLSRLYKVTDPAWNPATTNGKTQPTCESTEFISRDYKFSNAEYIIPKNQYTYVEFDITSLLSNLSENNYKVGIKIYNNETDGKGVYVKGPTSDMIPYVEFEGIENVNEVSFVGGEGAVGDMAPISALSGASVVLPECTYTKNGYAFAGWTDGTTTYAAGSQYIVPDKDVALTAIWKEKVNLTYYITKENSAFVTTETTFGGVDYTGVYDVEKNNIEANNGVAVIKTTSGILYYNLDLGAIRGKSFQSAKLRFAVMSDGGSWFMSRLYKVTDPAWDPATTNGKSQPTCEATASISRDYKFNNSEYIIPKKQYTYVEFDITDMLSNLSENNYKAGIKIVNADSDGMGIFVKGPTSDMVPYVVIENIKDGKNISFDSSGGVGIMSAITEAPGRSIILPECRYAKVGYSLAGWTDGTTTYPVGSRYTVPDTDVTLTAVWEKSGKWIYDIAKENAAYVVTATAWGSSNQYNYSDKYDTMVNNIEANDGIAVVRTGGTQKLFYKLDLGALKGKSFTKATLKIASKRGNGSWLAGNVSKTENANWNASDLNALNIPGVLSSLPSPVVTTYKSHSQSAYTYLDYDITSLLANISSDNHIIGIEFKNTDGDGEGSFIKGPTTDMPPYIEFEGIEDAGEVPEFSVKNGDAFDKIERMTSGKIRCQNFIYEEKGTEAIAFAAVYNRRVNELIKLFVSDTFTTNGQVQCISMDIDVTEEDLSQGDQLQMFIWSKDGQITPLSNPITISK